MRRPLELAALLAALAGPAPAQDSLRVGIEGAFPPWNALDAQGALTGMDVEVVDVLCERAAIECELVVGPWAGMVPGLQAGTYDAVMTMGINEEREKVIDFTIPYAQGVATFLVPAGGALAAMPMTGEMLNLDDAARADPVMAEIGGLLDGRAVGVVGSTSQERLIDERFGDAVEVRTYESSAARDLDLRAGRIDAGFDSGVYAAAMLQEPGNDDLAMTGPLLRGSVLATRVAIGVREGETALADRLSAAIRTMIDDGTIARITRAGSTLDLTPEPAT